MAKTEWFSCDDETGKVVAKTEIKSDGTVRRYPYTVPDKIKEGHGDTWYDSVDDFMKDMPKGSRDKDDPKSKDRPWRGNGYDLGVSDLMSLPYDELQMIADASAGEYIHSTLEIMSETLVSQQPKQLVLKK